MASMSILDSVKINSRYVGMSTADEMDRPTFPMRHYRVTLTHNGKRRTFDFYMGTALLDGPDLVDVVSSLLSDMDAGSMSFEEFCSEFGYNSDSIKALKIHKACQRNAERVKVIFGDDIEAFREAVEDVWRKNAPK